MECAELIQCVQMNAAAEILGVGVCTELLEGRQINLTAMVKLLVSHAEAEGM